MTYLCTKFTGKKNGNSCFIFVISFIAEVGKKKKKKKKASLQNSKR